MTSDTDYIEYLGSLVSEGRVLMAVQTNRTGDPERYRIGVLGLGESQHKEYVASDFREALRLALRDEDALPESERCLDLTPFDEPPDEEVQAVIACLGDDAAQLRDENPEDERAANMDEAADMLRRLSRANQQLFSHGEKMYAALTASPSQAAGVGMSDWKEALLDKLAICCMDAPIGTPPSEILDRVIRWHVQVATDPAVSEEAAKRQAAMDALTAMGWAWDRDSDKWRSASGGTAAPTGEARDA